MPALWRPRPCEQDQQAGSMREQIVWVRLLHVLLLSLHTGLPPHLSASPAHTTHQEEILLDEYQAE